MWSHDSIRMAASLQLYVSGITSTRPVMNTLFAVTERPTPIWHEGFCMLAAEYVILC